MRSSTSRRTTVDRPFRRPFHRAPGWTARVLSLALMTLALLAAHAPREAAAQSIVRGEIIGMVQGTSGLPIVEPTVTVTRAGSDVSYFADGRRDGTFLASMLEAGEYDVLVEAFGHVPRLVRGVRLRPGTVVRVSVTLTPTATPPTSIDTVSAEIASQPRFDGESGRWVRGVEIESYRDPRSSLARIVALAPMMDGSMGSEGLPGTSTMIMLDGIPFTPAVHPMQRAGADVPLFPRSGLASINIHRRADVEWTGAAGSYVAAASRSASGVLEGSAWGAGSAGALRDSEVLPESTTGGNGFWGGANVHIPLDDDGTRAFLAFEGMTDETPQPSPFSADLAQRLVDARQPGQGADVQSLTESWNRSLQAVSGLGRLDWRLAGSADVSVRGTFSTTRESGSRFFAGGPAPTLVAPFDGTDISLGASVLAEAHRLVTLEIRGGLERSTRDWSGPAGGSEAAPLPSTRFVESGVLLGADAGLGGSVTRTGFSGSAIAHYRDGPHWLKGGVSFSLASHTYEHVYGTGGEFLFSDPEAISAWAGVLRQSEGAAPSRSFTVPEFGLLGQYRWEPLRGVRLFAGIRWDREMIADVALRLPGDLPGVPEGMTTLSSSTMTKWSPRLGASWDLTGEGQTVVEASMGIQFDRFDPAALAEAYTMSGSVLERTVVGGAGAEWPGLPGGTSTSAGYRPTHTILGPSLRPPRTARASGGISQTIADGTTVHVSASFRRTEFLLRRSDLNLSVAPDGTLPDGRPVVGTLEKLGGVIAPLPGSNRRFQDFGPIWALTADGASEHLGFSIAMEHQANDRLDLFGTYTYSSTRDNLVGAASGHPGAMLMPSLPSSVAGIDWDEATSDFDIPHRFAAGTRVHFDALEGVDLSGVYRFESGRPFTAGYRAGVDVNGDGSWHNDPAFVPSGISGPEDRVGCVREDRGRIAQRNACRGEGIHLLDLSASIGIFRFGGSTGALTLELFNLLDAEMGRPDSALLLVDPSGTMTRNAQTGEYTIPFLANPDFGTVTNSYRPGRMLRIGFTLGTP